MKLKSLQLFPRKKCAVSKVRAGALDCPDCLCSGAKLQSSATQSTLGLALVVTGGAQGGSTVSTLLALPEEQSSSTWPLVGGPDLEVNSAGDTQQEP